MSPRIPSIYDFPDQRFDGAIFMAETFPLITDYADLASHFAAVGRHLRPGGIYIVDVDVHRHGPGTSRSIWGRRRVPLADGWVDVWHEDLPGDPVQGTSRLLLHCRIRRGQALIRTLDDWTIRQDAPWHLELLLRTLPGWTLTGFHPWDDPNGDLAICDHYFMVCRRTQ